MEQMWSVVHEEPVGWLDNLKDIAEVEDNSVGRLLEDTRKEAVRRRLVDLGYHTLGKREA